MEQLFEKLKNMLDELLKIKTSLENERSQVAETRQKQDGVAQVQAEQEADIKKREETVEAIEDVIAFKKSVEDYEKKINEGGIKFENAKNEFDAFVKTKSAELTARQKELNEQAAMYKRELDALQKAKENLAQEEINIKAKVIGNLAKNI